MGSRWSLVALVSVLLASGCTAADAEPPTPTTPTTPSAPSVTTPRSIILADYAGIPVDDLLSAFSSTHPGVAVEVRRESPASSFRPTLADALAGTEPLADVVILPSDAHGLALQSGEFSRVDRIAVDPAAICYRTDLMERAGMPSDPEGVADLLAGGGGGWEQFFSVGRQYRDATGAAWFGDDYLMWEALTGQLAEGVTAAGRDPAIADDAEFRARWDLLVDAIRSGLGAGEQTWDWRGGEALVDGSFAVMPCSPAIRDAMGALLDGFEADDARWAVADYFPAGGWSFADVYAGLTVDAADGESAALLYDWLSGEDGQAALARAGVGVPVVAGSRSQWEPGRGIAAADGEDVASIDRDRADGIPDHVAAPGDSTFYVEVVARILSEVRSGALDPGAAWTEVTQAARDAA